MDVKAEFSWVAFTEVSLANFMSITNWVLHSVISDVPLAVFNYAPGKWIFPLKMRFISF